LVPPFPPRANPAASAMTAFGQCFILAPSHHFWFAPICGHVTAPQ
jgi:hypothetical protein